MGGDEFAILLEDGGDATTVVAKILDGFTQPAAIGRDLVPLAASIGVAELSAGAGSLHLAEFLQPGRPVPPATHRRGVDA